MEPLEALRVALRFVKPGGWVLLNTHIWYPMDVTAGGMAYPSLESIIDALRRLEASVLSLDATKLAIQAGDDRTANCVMLGGLFALGEVDVTEENLFRAMKDRWPSHLVEVNQKAYQLGYESVSSGKGET
jgi:indolepyruvate ferredoxin oxidoreductase beta subunit